MSRFFFLTLTFCILQIPGMLYADEDIPVTEGGTSAVNPSEPAAEESVSQLPAQEKSGTAFVRDLHEKDRADYSDAMRIILTLVQNKDAQEPFETLRKKLMDQKIISRSWNYRKDSPLTKGMVSYMLCSALKIEGGLTMRVLGNSERYALRECQWIGLVMGGNQNEYVSGKDLLGIFSRAEIYKRDGNLKSIQ